MADLRPDRLTTYQSERKLVASRRPGVLETLGDTVILTSMVAII
jgi:hypothetical protein